VANRYEEPEIEEVLRTMRHRLKALETPPHLALTVRRRLHDHPAGTRETRGLRGAALGSEAAKERAGTRVPATTGAVARPHRSERGRPVRTVVAVVGCIAVVLAVGLALPAWVGFSDRSPRDVNTSQRHTVPSNTIDTRRSPLVAYAEFGWLPDSIVGVSYVMGADDATLAKGVGDLAPMIWLRVHDREPGSSRGGADVVFRVPTTVNGHRAYWATAHETDPLNDGDTILRWQLADGRWAEINSLYLGDQDPQQVLRRVAEDVTIEERAVPLPLQIAGLPKDFVTTAAWLSRPSLDGVGEWSLKLQYASGSANLTLIIGPRGPGEPRGASCITENDLGACADILPQGTAELDGIGGVQGLLDRINLLGMDEKTWTTRVVN
jgi:hypothetical protein